MAASHLFELGHTRIGHLSGTGGAAAHRWADFQGLIRAVAAECGLWGEADGTAEEDGYASAS